MALHVKETGFPCDMFQKSIAMLSPTIASIQGPGKVTCPESEVLNPKTLTVACFLMANCPVVLPINKCSFCAKEVAIVSIRKATSKILLPLFTTTFLLIFIGNYLFNFTITD